MTRRSIGIALGAACLTAYVGLSAVVGDRLTATSRHGFAHFPHMYGLTYQEVTFPSRDADLALSGWLIAPGDGVAAFRPVIMVHGWLQDRQSELDGQALKIAAHLVDGGRWVLMFDLRGWGRSEGSRFSLGDGEARDVRGAIDFLAARGLAQDGVDLVGYSMGAAASLLAAADDERVGALVADSAYAEVGPLLDRNVPLQSGLPPPFTPGAVLAASLLTGSHLYAVRPLSAVAGLGQRQVPLLVVHGEADTLVPIAHGRRLAASYGNAVETMFVPHAEHVRAYAVQPARYVRRVDAFLGRRQT